MSGLVGKVECSLRVCRKGPNTDKGGRKKGNSVFQAKEFACVKARSLESIVPSRICKKWYLFELFGSKPPYIMNSQLKEFEIHPEDNGEPLKRFRQECDKIRFFALEKL